jgi:hypothetical protein
VTHSRKPTAVEDSRYVPTAEIFVRELSPFGKASGQWPRNKELRPVPRGRGLS